MFNLRICTSLGHGGRRVDKKSILLPPDEHRSSIGCLGDIDPYPNFDLSKIMRPGFENSEELKTSVSMLCHRELYPSTFLELMKPSDEHSHWNMVHE